MDATAVHWTQESMNFQHGVQNDWNSIDRCWNRFWDIQPDPLDSIGPLLSNQNLPSVRVAKKGKEKITPSF